MSAQQAPKSKVGSPATIDICAGGSVKADSITFVNNHGKDCTVTGLGGLVDCGNSFTVPKKSSTTCGILANAQPGSYPYKATCCGDQTNPVIIYQ